MSFCRSIILAFLFQIIPCGIPPSCVHAGGPDEGGYALARDRMIAEAVRAGISTGLLYDLVAPLSGIERFDGRPSAVPAGLHEWKQVYYELYRASMDKPRWPSLQAIDEAASRAAASGTVPVGIIDLEYSRLRDGKPVKRRAVAAAAMKDHTFRGREVDFVTGGRWYFGAGPGEWGPGASGFPSRLEIDPGDGRGYRDMRLEEPVTAHYTSTGSRVCRVRITDADGDVRLAAFRFDVLALETPLPHDTIEVTASVPYEGGYGSGEAYVYLADSLASLNNPLVVIEGFDIDNTMFWEELYNDLNQQDLIERARAEGFDIVVLNFDDSTDLIQRNAFAVVELLEEIQGMIPPGRDIALVGASMGGLCCRYALSWMESTGLTHDVRTFISFDAPHGGANIPLGVQYWVKFFSVESAAASGMLTGLQSPAARQMLEYHFTDPPEEAAGSDPLRATLLGELDAVGGYPSLPRKVAFANGSGHAQDQGFSPGDQLISYEYTSLIVSITGNVWAVPDMTPGLIFDGVIDRFWPLPDDEMTVTVTGTRPIDGAPGGSRPSMAQMDSTEAPYGDIVALHDSHCFVPSISSLDLGTEDLFHDLASDPVLVSISPFDTVYYAEVNESHVHISPQCADRLLAEVRVGVTGEEPFTPPAAAVFVRNWPNPFNPSTTVRFAIGAPCRATLRVYDAAGRLVRTLADEEFSPGWQRISWDGTGEDGNPLASGVYFCRLRAGRLKGSTKMVLVR